MFVRKNHAYGTWKQRIRLSLASHFMWFINGAWCYSIGVVEEGAFNELEAYVLNDLV